MKNLGIWLADSPLGGAFKAGLGAVLVWVLANSETLGLPAVVIVALGAGLPVLINYLNTSDVRYGGVREDPNEMENM
jgi:uncharacterized membrane-anchored protein